jgi:hypothetical protein
MKITIDIDCTPEEARAMLGLPDVKPLQESMMAEMEERMRNAMQSQDMEALMKMWMPTMPEGAQGFEQLQKSFWSQMTSAMGASKSPDNK